MNLELNHIISCSFWLKNILVRHFEIWFYHRIANNWVFDYSLFSFMHNFGDTNSIRNRLSIEIVKIDIWRSNWPTFKLNTCLILMYFPWAISVSFTFIIIIILCFISKFLKLILLNQIRIFHFNAFGHSGNHLRRIIVCFIKVYFIEHQNFLIVIEGVSCTDIFHCSRSLN